MEEQALALDNVDVARARAVAREDGLQDVSDPDVYLTLQDACDRFFGGKITPISLRAEAKRGRLHITRVGRTDFVSHSAIRELMAAPREERSRASARASPFQAKLRHLNQSGCLLQGLQP